MWFAIVIELIVVALLHHCDDRPIAAMAGRIIAAELGRIEARRHASVEKEGIPAAEAVAEKTGEVVKAHILRSVEFTMKAGWIAPSMMSIGPDCVAKFASGLSARKRSVSKMPAAPLPM